MTGMALLTSCQATRHATSSSMIEGEWNITDVNGSAINAHPSPYVGFNTQEKRIYGNSGCNKISGSFDFKNKKPLLKMERRFHTIPLTDIKGKWRIVTVFGENISVSDQTPFITFDTDNSRISAFAGCNRLSGGIKGGEGNAISISDVISTRMACPDMATEQNVLTALGQVGSFGISINGNLLLFSAGGNAVMELMRINED